MSNLRSTIQTPSFWLVLFLLACFLLGLSIFRDFGVSFDEPGIYNFAPVVVDMYSTVFDPPERPVFQRETFLHTRGIPTDLFNYGPFYFIAAELFVRGLHTLGIQTPAWDLWHLAYFITFEASLLIFYLLCRRWLSGRAALATTALFATQPLIIGHVFMNPKDTPFMIFFMAAVWSGLVMADKLRFGSLIRVRHKEKNLLDFIKTEWQTISLEAKAKLRRDLLLLGGVVLLFVLAQPLVEALLQNSIAIVYSAPPDSPLGGLLRIFSSHPESIPLESFLTKGLRWLRRFEYLVILFMMAIALWKVYSLLPTSGQQAAKIISYPLQILFRSLTNPFVLLAGILLGLTFSIRMFAPLAGGLVLANLLWRARWQSLIPAATYGCIAAVTSYVTWPYLWGEPINRLLKSWEVMNAFSAPGSWYSLPSLLAIQYTEPAVILSMVGSIIVIVQLMRGTRSELFFLFLVWGMLPAVVLMLKEASLYNNFRQVLFIIPPFFMIAGLAIEKIIQYIRLPVVAGIFIIIILLPGIWVSVKLHPYEYVYYNQFVGGVSNASRRYDIDYWAVSTKETAQYLNETAPANSTILACAPVYTLDLYLRSDLQVTSWQADEETPTRGYDYYVVSGCGYIQNVGYPQAEVVFSVTRENTVLALVKSLKGNSK